MFVYMCVCVRACEKVCVCVFARVCVCMCVIVCAYLPFTQALYLSLSPNPWTPPILWLSLLHLDPHPISHTLANALALARHQVSLICMIH